MDEEPPGKSFKRMDYEILWLTTTEQPFCQSQMPDGAGPACFASNSLLYVATSKVAVIVPCQNIFANKEVMNTRLKHCLLIKYIYQLGSAPRSNSA